jgi:hypothetical protein
MKIAFAAFLLAASAFAQAPSTVVPTACGPSDVNFKVKLDNSQHTLAQPEPGKAFGLLYSGQGATVLWNWRSHGDQGRGGRSMGRRQ